MELIITSDSVEKNYWKDLWKYRELFYTLAWRDLKVRYKQTILGISWSVLRPVLTTLIFIVVFNKIAKLPSSTSAPYAILVLAGMLPWQFFSQIVSESGNSLTNNSNLISKVYFPRMLMPISTILVALTDLFISFIILIALFIFFNYLPPFQIICLPLFLLLLVLLSIGVGLLVSALNVKYRDFRFVVPFVLQIGMYLSPIGFSGASIPTEYEYLFKLNPFVGIINGFRWCLMGEEILWKDVVYSTLFTILFLAAGIIYFRKTEKYFADAI